MTNNIQTVINTVTTADPQHERAIRGAQVIQRFASTLTLREVRTRVVPHGVAPAWSTSNTITFSEADLADLSTAEGVLSFKGLSLHEVAHILFTPRSGTEIVRWVMSNKLGRSFNALEDQRIETLMVGRFGDPIVPWLTAVVVQHIAGNVQQLTSAFPLVRGRKYLPVQLRRVARDLYTVQDDIDELSSIIDEYRTLTFPTDAERAKPLIERYAELVKNLPEEPEGGCGKKPADSHESTPDSRPLKPREQARAKSKAEERDEEDEADTDPFDFGNPADDEPEESDDEPTESNGDDSDAGDDEDDDDDNGDVPSNPGWDDPDVDDFDESDDSDAPGDTPTDADGEPTDSNGDDTPGEKPTAGDNAGSTSDPESPAVTDLLDDIINDVIERLGDDLNKDIRSMGGEVDLESNKSATPPTANSISRTVDPETASASRAFGIELERLKAQYDPEWEREVKSGRINASRLLRGCELDEAFDKWRNGRDDAVDIEAVILLDNSGSMDGERSVHASNAMWGLKRALDKVNASCTVLTFSEAVHMLYPAQEQAGITVKRTQPRGGTNPSKALKYAQRVFADSDRAVKVLFTITDGAWSGDEADETIKVLRTAGVVTALAFINESPMEVINPHNNEVVSHITNARDLLFLGRNLVKVATNRNLNP